METPNTDKLLRTEASFGTTPASILGEMMRTGFCAIVEQLQITNEALIDLRVEEQLRITNNHLIDLRDCVEGLSSKIEGEINGKTIDHENLADKIAVALEQRELLR